MGDAPARTELKVTTGAIRGSRKVHINGVAMRQVMLEPSSGEAPVTLYDTSGPYTDSATSIDIMAGLAELRTTHVEELAGEVIAQANKRDALVFADGFAIVDVAMQQKRVDRAALINAREFLGLG